MAQGVKTGGRQKGTPNKATASVKDAARAYTDEALLTLAEIMRDDEQPAAARVAASNAILDRGHGKPTQIVDATVTEESYEDRLKRVADGG